MTFVVCGSSAQQTRFWLLNSLQWTDQQSSHVGKTTSLSGVMTAACWQNVWASLRTGNALSTSQPYPSLTPAMSSLETQMATCLSGNEVSNILSLIIIM